MLRSPILLVIFASVFFPDLSFSAQLEIPLTVVSPVDPWTTQVVPFEIGLPIEQISGIALSLQGTYNDQLFLCGGAPYDIQTAASRVELSLGDDVFNLKEIQVVYSFPANPGDPLPFDITATLVEEDVGDWLFLADGISQLGITDHPRSVVDDNWMFCSPGDVFGTLVSATLVVTYDPNVPVEAGSWGMVKSIYR